MANAKCSIDMTLCPECVQYVRHCLDAPNVDCPFCETSFSPADVAGDQPTASRVPSKLKRGVMAASFVGATVLGGTGCPVAQPEYGAPMPPVDAGELDADDDQSDTDETDVDESDAESADTGDTETDADDDSDADE